MRRLITSLLSLLAIAVMALALVSSWFQVSPQTRLDLFQTNFSLQAARLLDDPEYQTLAQFVVGSDPVPLAIQRYQKAAQAWETRLTQIETPPPEWQTELDALRLHLGILLAYNEDIAGAQTQWQAVQDPGLVPVARALLGLWDPAFLAILPEADLRIQATFDGWFEGVSLQRLYLLQQRTDTLANLNTQQERQAISALLRLTLVATVPLAGILIGIVIVLVYVGRAWWRKKPLWGGAWSVSWSWPVVQEVLTYWFLLFIMIGEWVPSLFASGLGLTVAELSPLQRAWSIVLNYGLGAIAGVLIVLRLTHSDSPPWRWRLFDNWFLWAIGGYLAALPLVVIAANVAQQILPNAGGGNPILRLILESRGWIAQALFLLVVSVMAPIFEEFLFRGFLLTSLSTYMPMGAAIALSAVAFAAVHLNLSDFLPLTVLGVVLGITYSRSRNLLAPILLHSLWNTGSLTALLLLGS